MELTKSQTSLVGLTSRCRSLLFGVAFGLLISAAFTSNFAAKIVPNPLAHAWIPLSSPNASISSQLYILFFRSTSAPLNRDSPAAVYVSAVDDNYPEMRERNVGSDQTRMSGESSSPTDHAQAMKDDSLTAHSLELEFREKEVNIQQGAYDPPAPPPEEEAGPEYAIIKAPAPAEYRAITRANDSLPIDSSAPINDSDDRRNSTRVASSTAKEAIGSLPIHSSALIKNSDDRTNSTRVASFTAVEVQKKLPVHSSALIKDSDDRRNSTRAASSKAVEGKEKLPSPSKLSKRSGSRCDLSVGRWVRDDSYPLYKPGSCPFVDEGFNCLQNGRPDTEFSRWRWSPRDCTVPRMNGTNMLERLRAKRLVFVGDSLNRNQWESLLCILRDSLPDKSRLVELHGGRISKLPGAYVFKFLDYDCRLEFYTSHFLVDDDEGTSEQSFTVNLDRIDRSERMWRKANVLVFNTGHWWTPDKIAEGDNRFREGARLYPKLDVMVAYRKAIRTWVRWVEKHVDPANTRVFFRGYSPVHYIGGQWNSGGQCHNETQPIFNESFLTPYPERMKAVDDMVTQMRVPVQILNITRMSDFRKDAHPAIFGHRPQEIKDYQDCSHWCLPGLPDTWNELLYFALFVES